MPANRSLLSAIGRYRGLVWASACLGFALAASSSHAIGIQAWRGLKYGMFLHYGMSTFDGVEQSDGKSPASMFKPANQDVEQWVRVAKGAGMKYAVLVSKHTAGFCLWDSKVTWKGAEYAYDVGAGPVKTDIVGEFVKACGKYGIVPGIYYNTMDRHNSHTTVEWTPKLPYLTPEYFQLMQDHLTELHTRYPAIGIQWIDIPRHLDAEQRTILYNLIHKLNPGCLVEFNYGTESRGITGDYTIEVASKVTWPTDILNSEVGAIKKPFQAQQTYQGKTYELGYEHCVSLVGSWFWEPGTAAKPVATVTGIYNGIQALNGNLLLNVPPDQTGQIPDAFVKRLNEIRDALKLDTTTTPSGLGYSHDWRGRLRPGRETGKEFNPVGQELPRPFPEGRTNGHRATAVRLEERPGDRR